MNTKTKTNTINPAEALHVSIDLGQSFKKSRDPAVTWFAENVVHVSLAEYFIQQRGQPAFKDLSRELKDDLSEGVIDLHQLDRSTSITISQIVMPHLTIGELMDALQDGDFPYGETRRGRELVEKTLPLMLKDPVVSCVFKDALEKFDKHRVAIEKQSASHAKQSLKKSLAHLKKLGYAVTKK